jgi:hypothetical protein
MNKIQTAQRNATIALHKQALRIELARHPEVKNILMMFPPALRKEVRLHLSDYGDSVNFTLTMRDLESFKDKQLTKLLAKFAGDEWQTQTSDYTYSDAPNRDFSFNRTIAWTPKPSKHTRWLDTNEEPIPNTFRVYITLYTYVKSDSPTCRIVVEGYEEEVVRKEIKKIVCA